MKPHFRLRLIRPLQTLSIAEKRATVRRDFRADPWIVGEGPRVFTPEMLASMAADNEARRNKRK